MPPNNSSKLLHENGKNRYSKDFVSLDPATWPKEWHTTFYKEYSRFSSVPLPEIEESKKTPLIELIGNRKSKREFRGHGLSLSDLGLLLKYSCGEFKTINSSVEEIHRAQPSAGARWPIEMYVILRKSKDANLKPGVYHYNVKLNTLEFLWEEKDSKLNPGLLVRDDWAEKADAIFVMSSVFWRSQNKYGDRGYRYLCVEVGAIIQNLYLLTATLGMSVVAYGGTNDDEIEKLLALDTNTESLITTVLIGS